MILTEKVEIKIVNSKIREYYKNAGYNTENYKIFVLVKDLLKNSHVLVDVKCDICGHEKNLKYSKYIKNYSKYQIYACSNLCAQVKNKMTSIQNFGVEHHSKSISHRKKISKLLKGKTRVSFEERICYVCSKIFNINPKKKKITCSKSCYNEMVKTDEYKNMIINRTENSIMNKYGVSNHFQRQDIIDRLRKIRISKGLEIPDEKLTDWLKYKRAVNRLTVRNKARLYSMWDGYDYYDGEYIKDNLNLKHTNNCYPNIDHKISVFYGFINDIDPSIISDIDNLCITKRILNIKKRTKNEKEFISSL